MKYLIINKKYLIGALTSKPYAFMSRSWDLKNYESIDIFDNFGSNIRFDVNNLKILRVLPKINKNLNEEWITDKIRFCYDGLRKQRLNLPMIRQNNILISTNWFTAFENFKKKVFKNKINLESFCGDLIDLETIFIFKKFLNKLGFQSFKIDYFNNFLNTVNLREFYICTLNNIKIKLLNNLIFIGLNLRLENPILNLKIRKHVLQSNLKIFNFGFNYNLTYTINNFGNNIYSLINFFEGKSILCQNFFKNKLTYILIGYHIFYRKDFLFFKNLIYLFKLFFKNFDGSYFFQGANIISNLEIGMNSCNLIKNFNLNKKILYLLDMDNIFFNKNFYSYIIYQGHHGGLNMYLSDLVFPGAIAYEKEGTFFNLYGLRQLSTFILTPKNNIKNDWKIIKALSDFLNIPLYYNKRMDILKDINKLITLNHIYNFKYPVLNINTFLIYNTPILNFMGNYYLTNSITRSSLIMALCALRFKVVNFF